MRVYPSAVTIEVELTGAGFGWTELLDVQAAVAIEIATGMGGTGQQDRVATTGTASFALDNSERNSQGKLGLYSRNHVNRLSGWDHGIGVRISVAYDGSVFRLFVGTVDSISVVPGRDGPRKAQVNCVDWMNEAARASVSGLPVQIDKRSDLVFGALVSAVEKQPAAVFAQPGGDIYPFALDNAPEESVGVMTEFQRLATSERGYVFMRGDGTLIFESRFYRANPLELEADLGGGDVSAMSTARGRDAIINRVEVQAHPRRVDAAATTVLFRLNSTPAIPRGTQLVLRVLFRDPDARATRVGGVDMLQPVPTTDYTFNEAEDGSGEDRTVLLNVSAVYGANSGDITIANNGTKDGFLTKLEGRGRGIFAYETVVLKASDQASQDLYGDAPLAIDMPYQDDVGVALEAAQYVVAQSKTVFTEVDSVTFFGNREDRLMRYALGLDVSAKVRVTDDVVGTAEVTPVGETHPVSALTFFVNSRRLRIEENGIVTCTWGLAPADPYTYWILDSDGFTELDETTRLAYGSLLPGWVMDESELDISTRLVG